MIIQQQKKERTPGSGSTGPAAGPGGGGLPPVWPGAVRVGNMSLVGLRGAGHGSGEEANHMPNRVIRDSILTSRQVARLDWFQQALFVRLILGCDDYGRYYGAPDIICGHLFSTSSGVTQELVAEGLGKLEEEGLIVTYQVEGRNLLRPAPVEQIPGLPHPAGEISPSAYRGSCTGAKNFYPSVSRSKAS